MLRNLTILTATAAVVLAVPAVASAQYNQLDVALRKKAPEIIDFAKKQGYKNIGVVKFLVAQGDGEPSDDAGELNMSLTDRLELAIILANPNEDLGIIYRASSQLIENGNVLANHRDLPGRREFFRGTYGLAWGTRRVKADGFITGVATLANDLSEITVKLQAFGSDGKLIDIPGGTFTEPVSSRILAESGVSYYLRPEEYRKALDGARVLPKGQRQSREVVAVQIEQHKARMQKLESDPGKPVEVPALAEGPVQLTMILNGRRVELTDGRAPEPKAGDDIAFELFNRSNAVCGVVLKINGESTIGRERGNPEYQPKWVLGPKEKVLIKGFYVEDEKIEPFKILPPEESDASAVRYGDNAGTIRMTVWRGAIPGEQKKPDQKVVFSKEEEEERSRIAIANGADPNTNARPLDLKSLQTSLILPDLQMDGARGLVVGGKKKGGGETQTVPFRPESSIPVAEAVIRYYDPKKPANLPKVSK